MKSTIKTVVFCTGSFALGYVIAEQRLKQNYLDRTNQEVAEAKEQYEDRYNKMAECLKTEPEPDFESSSKAASAAKALLNYQTGLSVPVEAEVQTQAQILPYQGAITDTGVRDPYIITEEMYLNSELGYDQQTLLYYTGDDVLTNSSDDEISGDDREKVLAGIILVKTHNHAIYIRSHELERDFELNIYLAKYGEVVLGLGDDG